MQTDCLKLSISWEKIVLLQKLVALFLTVLRFDGAEVRGTMKTQRKQRIAKDRDVCISGLVPTTILN